MKKYKVGDIVYHVTNDHQKMVVLSNTQENLSGYLLYSCSWINTVGSYFENYFRECELNTGIDREYICRKCSIRQDNPNQLGADF